MNIDSDRKKIDVMEGKNKNRHLADSFIIYSYYYFYLKVFDYANLE